MSMDERRIARTVADCGALPERLGARLDALGWAADGDVAAAEVVLCVDPVDTGRVQAALDQARGAAVVVIATDASGPAPLDVLRLGVVDHRSAAELATWDDAELDRWMDRAASRGRRHGGGVQARRVDELQRELALTRERADDADRAKSAFLANMSHELRTPLNAILGYTELLEEDLLGSGGPAVLEDLARIRRAGAHLLSLISDVLELARIEAGRTEVYLERIPIRPALERVIAAHVDGARRRGNTLELGDVPTGDVVTDVAMLCAALDRLVGNATKFTQGGHVVVDALASDEGLTVRVRDTGIGISPEQRRLIFREFSQADPSTTRRFGGTGLGLTIAHRLVERLGGSIDVDSVQGEGSTFAVRLPPAPERFEPARLPQPSPASGARADAPLILVIDADAGLRQQMCDHLLAAGYRVLSTSSGVEGLRIARARRPALIVLDVVLPDIDGWNLLMAFKREPRLTDTPIVLATLADDRSRGLAVGATDYLAKPIRRDALLATVRRTIPGEQCGAILVVEDDEATRDVAVRMLRGEGWEVDSVGNGREALEWLEDHPIPALILLDLMMPGIDGFHVVTELQCQEQWRDIPVVVFTAMEVPPARLAFLEQNVDSVIRKGGQGHDRMLEEVRALIERSLG